MGYVMLILDDFLLLTVEILMRSSLFHATPLCEAKMWYFGVKEEEILENTGNVSNMEKYLC